MGIEALEQGIESKSAGTEMGEAGDRVERSGDRLIRLGDWVSAVGDRRAARQRGRPETRRGLRRPDHSTRIHSAIASDSDYDSDPMHAGSGFGIGHYERRISTGFALLRRSTLSAMYHGPSFELSVGVA